MSGPHHKKHATRKMRPGVFLLSLAAMLCMAAAGRFAPMAQTQAAPYTVTLGGTNDRMEAWSRPVVTAKGADWLYVTWDDAAGGVVEVYTQDTIAIEPVSDEETGEATEPEGDS